MQKLQTQNVALVEKKSNGMLIDNAAEFITLWHSGIYYPCWQV
jgi:hypothetical protein